MPLLPRVTRQSRGLHTFRSSTEPPQPHGGMIEAKNCVIDGEFVLSKRSGFNRYGDQLANTPKQLLDYRDRILVHHGTTLSFDSDGAGTWTDYTGSFSEPDSENKIRGFEVRSNLYFTSSLGVYRTDQLTNDPVLAGVDQALAPTITETGTGGDWFGPNAQVSYRILFLREDSNDNPLLVPGAVSRRVLGTSPQTDVTWSESGLTVTVTHTAHGYSTSDTVEISDAPTGAEAIEGSQTITVVDANTYTYTVGSTPSPTSGSAKAGKKLKVDLDIPIPDGITASDFYEIYRTEQSVSDNTDPGDTHKLVGRQKRPITAAEITAGKITITDDQDDLFLGFELYTNDTLDTISQSNRKPPFCTDLAQHKGHVFFCNTRREHFVEIQLVDLTALTTSTSTISFTDGTTTLTYTAETAEDASAQEFKKETGLATNFQNIEATMISLENVINRDTNNTLFYAVYNSEVNDSPGKLLITRKDLTDTAISITANSTTTGDGFSPALPTSGTSVSTENDRGQNRLYWSKPELPDAVPATNFERIGSELSPIVRIIAIRDYLIILKEEGVWRLSGTPGVFADWDIQPLDSNARIIAPESAVEMNNQVYCFTDIGIVQVNESGTPLVSRPIESDILRRSQFANFSTNCVGTAYDNRKKYICWLPDTANEDSDGFASKAYVYDYLNDVWTEWFKDVTCSRVLFDTNELFVGHAKDKFVLKERKSLLQSNTDFSDEDIPVTVTAVDTTTDSDGDTVSTVTVTYTYTGATLAAGFLFKQTGNGEAKVTAVTDNGSNSFTLTLEFELPDVTTGAATVSLPIVLEAIYRPETVGYSGINKQFPEFQFYPRKDEFSKVDIGFFTNVDRVIEFTDTVKKDLLGFGLTEFGVETFGDEDPISATPVYVEVPRDKQECVSFSVVIKHSVAKEDIKIETLTYVYRTLSRVVNRANVV